MDKDQTSYIMDKINTHTKNLNSHRLLYRNLLIISICLLIVSIIFLYSIYGVVKKKDRSAVFKYLTYIDSGIIGGSIIILIIILIYRFNKEGKQKLNGINDAIKEMGEEIKVANRKAADEKSKGDTIKKAAKNLSDSLKNLEKNKSILENI